MICIEDFLPGNAGEYDLSLILCFYDALISTATKRRQRKLPSIYFVFDPLLGLSEMMFVDIDGDMNCI